jgi:type IV secretory pathway VirJ component
MKEITDSCASGLPRFALLWALALAAIAAPGASQSLETPAASSVGAPVAEDSADVSGLPLIERRSSAPNDSRLVVLLTGDGGFAAADEAMALAFNQRGLDVVALDSRKYLRTPRSPAEATRDLARILRHYVAAWQRNGAIVVGYSRGADMAPIMISELPDTLRREIDLVALLGPDRAANFHFHWIDIVRNVSRPDDVPLAPSLEKIHSIPIVCIYGAGDHHALCPELDPSLARVVRRDGGHRITVGDAPAEVNMIFSAGRETRTAMRSR